MRFIFKNCGWKYDGFKILLTTTGVSCSVKFGAPWFAARILSASSQSHSTLSHYSTKQFSFVRGLGRRQEALKGQMFSTCWAHSHLHDNHSSSFRLSSLRCIDFSLAWCWLWEYLCWMFTINRRSSPAEASVWETFPNLLTFKISWNFDMFDVLT